MTDTDKTDRRIRAVFSFFAFVIAILLASFVVAFTGGDPLAYPVTVVFLLGYTAGRITRGLDS